MPVSDALLVGEDWISEHYFTTDATKESFQGRVIERRKEWDGAEDGLPTTRSRFTSARADLESRLVALGEAPDEGGEADFDDQLLSVLGYMTGQWRLTSRGPLTGVSSPDADLTDEVINAPLVIIRAKAVVTVDDLLAKSTRTLLVPWERDDEDPVLSVATTLSTLMTDADGPAFALVLAGRWALLAEKERWPEGRWLAVDLQLVCERNDSKRGGEVDRALACLDAQSLAPDAAGTIWWGETLEASIKHTVGVSRDLQDGVRESIEIIANEVVRRRRDQGVEPLPDAAAQVLAVQSLRYLYRILFLLYAEASPELGVLPVGAEEYDAGYGLDRLRDLALTEIHTERARSGTHLYASLGGLFRLVDQGHAPAGDPELPDGLVFNGLRADLFADEATSLINEVKLGNDALLQVLRKLLLSKEQGSKQRGFISYVELGINQLGAVYEGLMSYTGSFANEDLHEVAKNGDRSNGSWVVPVSRSDHLAPEYFVREEDEETGDKRPVLYRQGEFVFRLSGRDRQRSASYYTPEVLTRFTVQQALEELLDQDGTTTTAEEILGLTVCEPALGSGAFAIEAVRQLAEEYISRRESELGERVDPDQRPKEVQRAKAHIALHQVYGVDLNSTAVELAEVSLWLETMVEGLQAPWFGLRLRQGNSLVGARRALYPERQVKDRSWLTTPPQDAELSGLAAALYDGRDRDPSITSTQVHHFLLPAQGWGSASEVPKSVRDLVPEERIKGLKMWRRSLRKKPSAPELKRLQALAQRVEALWGITLRRLRIAEDESSRAIDLWGRDTDATRHAVTREQIEATLADEDGAYRRLRLVMDAWCALWYWPLTDVDTEPPTFDEWLSACEQILGRGDRRDRGDQGSLNVQAGWDELGEAEELDLRFAGAERIARVRRDHPWLEVCKNIASEQAFFHWELDFATVFARGGFDLQIGNPPWVRPSIDEEQILAEGDPWWALAASKPEEVKVHRRERTLNLIGMQQSLVREVSETAVFAESLRSEVCYPLLSGRPDLYRAFMAQVWRNSSMAGVQGLIHMESHFTDIGLEGLRRESYRRLRRHWQFINELKLFDIQNQRRYGVHVYGISGEVDFINGTSMYHPETVTSSLRHNGDGHEPGVKNSDGKWDLSAHSSRIQRVSFETLRVWADVLDVNDPSSTPMLYTVNQSSLDILTKLTSQQRIARGGLEFCLGWDETAAKRKGRIKEAWGSSGPAELVMQGSHIFVSNPAYKAPTVKGMMVQDWPEVDHRQHVNGLKLARKFVPGDDWSAYVTEFGSWSTGASLRDSYRIAWRCQVPNDGERTLASAIIPPGPTHTGSVNSAGSDQLSGVDLAFLQGVLSSILSDFVVRAAPKSNIRARTINRIPLPQAVSPMYEEVAVRVLQLGCISSDFAALWGECMQSLIGFGGPVLARSRWQEARPEWSAETVVTNALDRRNIQVEIDVLVGLMMGVSSDELCTVYRTQFPVLRSYDRRKYMFDARGEMVPTSVIQKWRRRKEPDDNADMPVEERRAEHPGSGVVYTYDLPFGTLDREADFRTAYAEFERRLAEAEADTA